MFQTIHRTAHQYIPYSDYPQKQELKVVKLTVWHFLLHHCKLSFIIFHSMQVSPLLERRKRVNIKHLMLPAHPLMLISFYMCGKDCYTRVNQCEYNSRKSGWRAQRDYDSLERGDIGHVCTHKPL